MDNSDNFTELNESGQEFHGKGNNSMNLGSTLKVVRETQEMFQKQQRMLVVLLEDALRSRATTTPAPESRLMANDRLDVFAPDLDEPRLAISGLNIFKTSSAKPKAYHSDLPPGCDMTRSVCSVDTGLFKNLPHRETSTMELLKKLRTKSRTANFTFREVQSCFELRQCVLDWIHSRSFDFAMGMIILANSIYIGFELDSSINESHETLAWIEYVFMSIYLVELILRLWAFGLKESLRNNWIMLDLALVGIGMASLLIIEPIRKNVDSGERLGWLSQLILIRLLRLLRLVRAFRFFKEFKILWGLVNGLLSASPALVSTFALLFLLLYMFAVCGVELISKDDSLHAAAQSDPELKRVLENNFDSLAMVMVTLMRFTTCDSVASIYEPLVRTKPGLIIYFVAMLLVVSITIMNLITAVLVEHSIAVAKNDVQLENHRKRVAVRKMIPEIERIFSQLDVNNDGQVTFQETVTTKLACPKDLEFLVKDPNLLVDLFDLLDKDRSGHIDKDEFTEGLVVLALSDVSMETIKLINYSRGIKRTLSQIKKFLTTLNTRLADSQALGKTRSCFGEPLVPHNLTFFPTTPTQEAVTPHEVSVKKPSATPLRPASLMHPKFDRA